MGQDPAVIRRQIEQTREHMGDTVDALGYKADVPTRTKEAVSDKVESIRSRITGASARASEAMPEADDVTRGAKQAVGVVQENPLGLALGSLALGFLAGIALPHTKVEDEKLGPVADEVKQQVQATGQEAVEHGRQVAQDAAGAVAEQAQEALGAVRERTQESAQEHASELADSAKESAEQVRSQAQS